MLAGSITEAIQDLGADPQTFVENLARGIAIASQFFLNYLLMQAFSEHFFELAQTVLLLVINNDAYSILHFTTNQYGTSFGHSLTRRCASCANSDLATLTTSVVFSGNDCLATIVFALPLSTNFDASCPRLRSLSPKPRILLPPNSLPSTLICTSEICPRLYTKTKQSTTPHAPTTFGVRRFSILCPSFLPNHVFFVHVH